MKILATGKKNGCAIIIGRGTYEEVESLNIEKDFETALDVLSAIRKTRRAFFGQENESNRVNRTIIGKRKWGEE